MTLLPAILIMIHKKKTLSRKQI